MGNLELPQWMQAPTGDPVLAYDAATARRLTAALLGAELAEGTLDLGTTSAKVVPRGAGANMSVDVVGPAHVFVAGDNSAGQGTYMARLPGTLNVPIAAAPGAGLSRRSLICARVRDPQAGGPAGKDGDVIEVAGPAATTGTEVDPATPATHVRLARVTVPSGTAAITDALITDLRPKAAVWAPAAAGAQKAFRTNYSAGTITLPPNMAWQPIGTIEGTLSAGAGEWIEVGLSVTADNGGGNLYWDAVTTTAGVPVRSLGLAKAFPSGVDEGVSAWHCEAGRWEHKGGSILYLLQKADIDSVGTVRVALWARCAGASGRNVPTSSTLKLTLWGRVLG